MEYKYSSKNKSPPTLAIAGSDTMKVLNTIFKLFALLISLMILQTLKALIILVAPPKLTLVLAEMKMLTKEPMTMMKSNTFQASLKYCFLKAMILRMASTVKTAVKK